jgi:prepilin-type N-terminal cleavage/methylation domain-containing protein
MRKQLMNKRFIYKSAKSDQHGFSITEVMVSILVLTLFTLSASSLMVYAAQNRVSARSDGEVTDELQELTEKLRDDASALAASTSACNATAVADGYGQLLASSLSASASSIALNGRNYNVTRALTPVNAAPFDRLEVTYTFTAQARTSDTITMTTEIIPNVAFDCP